MKVILQQDVQSIGRRGEAHEVAPGYFRNYLQPRGLAVEATSGRVRAQHSHASRTSTREAREVEQTRELAERLSALKLTFNVKVGEQGRMYGSITAKDVADEIKRSADVEVDRHKVVLTEALRSAGEHTVTVKLDHGIDADLKVDLVPEEES